MCAYKCIMWGVTPVILSKPLPAVGQISGRKVSLQSWTMESRVSQVSLARVPDCPGDLVQGSSFQVRSSSLFITFGVTERQFPGLLLLLCVAVKGQVLITVSLSCTLQGFCPYTHQVFFLCLHPSRPVPYTYQGFFVLQLLPIRVSAKLIRDVSGLPIRRCPLSVCLQVFVAAQDILWNRSKICGSKIKHSFCFKKKYFISLKYLLLILTAGLSDLQIYL